MRRNVYYTLAVLVGVALGVTACGNGFLLGPEPAQGVEGLVLIGPQCPVHTLEDPCPDLPHRATIDVRTRAGTLVTRVTSGDDGTFRVGLQPGSYTLDPRSGDPFPIGSPEDIEVEPGVFTDVTIYFDTGIR